MNRIAALVAVGLAVTACSQATGGAPAAPPQPEPEPTFDPVGVYDYSTEVQGQSISGTFTISGSPGAYTGSMTSDMGGITLRDFSINGMEMTFVGDMPDATVFFILTFSGMSFTGEWEAEGLTGFMSGTKR